jgi:Ca2+-binding EF-hand superfamily protein
VLCVSGKQSGAADAVPHAQIETGVVDHLLEFVEEADRDKNGMIDFEEWITMCQHIKKRIPMTEVHLERVRDLFELYDSDKDESLTLNELAVLLQELGSRITALPAVRASLCSFSPSAGVC